MDMIFDDMRRVNELLALVRLDEQYCSAVMSGQLKASDQTNAQHNLRATRIAELTDRYGLRT